MTTRRPTGGGDADRTPDTPFGEVITAAEDVRVDPATGRAQLERQKDILERINTPAAG